MVGGRVGVSRGRQYHRSGLFLFDKGPPREEKAVIVIMEPCF
jgi:hypothetical protein